MLHDIILGGRAVNAVQISFLTLRLSPMFTRGQAIGVGFSDYIGLLRKLLSLDVMSRCTSILSSGLVRDWSQNLAQHLSPPLNHKKPLLLLECQCPSLEAS